MPPLDLSDPIAVGIETRRQATSGRFPPTDLGNGERLVALHGDDLRFAPSLGWLAWDDRRWRPDSDGEVSRRMKDTVRAMLREAALIEDREERKALLDHERRSEAEVRIRAAISLASTELPVVVDRNELDREPFLLTVENGTIDLRSGELLPHSRDHLATKLAPVVFDPEARSPLWERFLEDVTGGDEVLTAFLQRAVGYSLTGDTSEEVFFFAHGPSATGKSSFLEAVKTALGDYAMTADSETFLARRGDVGIRNDIARLAGSRLVASVEIDEGRRLAAGLIKHITGGDKVAARHLYHDFFEFTPRFKLWLAANERPPASAGDDALWRRVVQVPFVHVVPEGSRDPHLKTALCTDPEVQSAVLAWAVAGVRQWCEQRLAPPPSVVEYTAAYRAENDPLADFIGECCSLADDLVAPGGALRSAYLAWAEATGEEPVSKNEFRTALRSRGLEPAQVGGKRVRVWRGIGLTG